MLRIVVISALTFIGMAILGRVLRIGLYAYSIKRERARAIRDEEKTRRERFLFDPSSHAPTTKKEVFETAQYVEQQTKYASLCVTQVEENLERHAKAVDLAERITPMVRNFKKYGESVNSAISLAKRYCDEHGVNVPRNVAYSDFPELTTRLRAALRSSGLKLDLH